LETLPEEEFFNVKTEEDVEQFIEEARSRRAS
jgi:acyl carrier protein